MTQNQNPKRFDRFDNSKTNISYTRTGREVYGIQDSPGKKVLRYEFESKKAMDRNREYEKSLNRINPYHPTKSNLFKNENAHAGNRKCTQTFCSSPDNPLRHDNAFKSNNATAKNVSHRYAARLAFEEAHANASPQPPVDKYAEQRVATANVKQVKVKENNVLKVFPHGATRKMVHETQPEGMSLPRLGFGGAKNEGCNPVHT